MCLRVCVSVCWFEVFGCLFLIVCVRISVCGCLCLHAFVCSFVSFLACLCVFIVVDVRACL